MKIDEYISDNFDNCASNINFEALICNKLEIKDEITKKYFLYYKISASIKKIKARILNLF